MYLAGFCELASKPMWLEKWVRVNNFARHIFCCCWELYLFWLTLYPYSPCLFVNGSTGFSAWPKIKKTVGVMLTNWNPNPIRMGNPLNPPAPTQNRQNSGCALILGGGGGGIAIYWLYRYVPLWRVWFSSSLLLDRVYKSESLHL